MQQTEQHIRDSENWAVDRSESAKWVIVGLIAIALLFFWLGDSEPTAAQRNPFFLVGLLIAPSAYGLWELSKRRPQLALQLSGFIFAILVGAAAHWMQAPGLFLLSTIPVIHLTLSGQQAAAAAIGLLLSALLWFGETPFQRVDRIVLIATIAALWSIGARARYTMTSRITWAWQHYTLAQQRLDDARDRNQQLDSVLDQQVHMNRQLDLLNERLAALRARAEESQRTKTAFVAKVSHEFRTPLNMIIGLVDLLIENPKIYGERLPSLLVEDMRIVHRNCEHLLGMINDVLDLSQTEAGRLNLRREVGDLGADLHHAVDIVRPLIDKKGLILVQEIPDSPILCPRDQIRIRQVLLNLLSNAARYTHQGMITVRLLPHPRHIRIEIADTGPGIEPDDLDRLFEPFFQSGHLEGRSQIGSGLGLSISKQFMELHGGQLGVESQKGVGSTFWLTLPLAPANTPLHKAERWVHEDWAWYERQSLAPLPNMPRQQRVLLLDLNDGFHPLLGEQPDAVELISKDTVEEITEDAELIPAHGILINGPTIDAVLPVMVEISHRIPDTPVIGWTIPTPANQAHDAGAMDYLLKPVTRADLTAALDAIPSPLKRVLIVDDDLEVQRLLTRTLHAHDKNIEVATACDVKEGLAQLHKIKPDLLLLDLILRQGTGWELLNLKKKEENLANIPAIIISAQDPLEEAQHSPILMASMGHGLPLSLLQQSTIHLIDMLLNGPTIYQSAVNVLGESPNPTFE